MMKTLFAAAAAALISTAAFAESHGHGESHVLLKDVEWADVIPGVQIAHAWGDDATGAVWLVKMQPGVALPMHVHTNDYWGTGIYGNWVHIDADGIEVPTVPGDYSLIKGGTVHADRCDGDVECVILLDFAGPRDVEIVQ